MADITLPRGDSGNFQLTFLQSDGVTPVDISNAIVRFAVKERYGQSNSEAKIFKTSYTSEEIEITDAVNGVCVVYVRVDDTIDTDPGAYLWGSELTRKSTLVTSAGTLSFTAGSSVAQASGVDFTKLRIGQYVEPNGSLSGNNVPILITAIDETNQTITFEGYNLFSTEATVPYSSYRGDRKTPTGLSGKFNLQPDVVR